MLKLFIAASLLLAGTPVVAQTQSAQQQQSTQPATAQAKARSRVICRDVDDIGSRLQSHRICMTADQWKQQEQDSQDVTAANQHQGPH
jgi:hypothetical protein